ncbi:MAG TPA: 16S rRNA (guanine(527)-N(7))-methyltransferase RsmG [Spirochaetia bacterium]|nr:16S rRNA (guanine(527)-N(7))-methyltransferase RsmG [Spirochaetia bacterium]
MSVSDEPSALLNAGLARLGLPDPDSAREALSRYLDELERWNPRFGFVNARSRAELVVRHVLDSLAPWRHVRDETRGDGVLDVGSGAGFPGIPLAIVLPGVSFTLLERSAKKISFLKTCVTLLSLERVRVEQGAFASVKGVFDVVTFRAVAPLARFLADAPRAFSPSRVLVAYKGKLDRARSEVEELQSATGNLFHAEVIPVTVPFLDEERCVVILRHSLTNG